MTKWNKLILLVSFCLLSLVSLLPKGYCIEDTIYLDENNISHRVNINAKEGDTIEWSFRSYNESFQVLFWSFDVSDWTISSGKTSDRGSLEVLVSKSIAFFFENMEYNFNSGYLSYKIAIQIISGFNIFLILGIIGIILIITTIKVRKK